MFQHCFHILGTYCDIKNSMSSWNSNGVAILEKWRLKFVLRKYQTQLEKFIEIIFHSTGIQGYFVADY